MVNTTLGKQENLTDFINLMYISDPDVVPSLYEEKYGYVLSRLYLKKNTLFSMQNAIFYKTDDKVVGMAYCIPANCLKKLYFITALSTIIVSPINCPKIAIRLLTNDSLLANLEADSIYVSNIAVYSEYRNQGVGKALINQIIRESKRNGYKKIVLDVKDENKDALNVYKKLGFKVINISNVKISDRCIPYIRMSYDIH